MNSLDSGWALVIGAVIALIGSVAAPWIRDVVERHHQTRLDYREQTRDTLIDYQAALVSLIRAVMGGADMLDAMQSMHLSAARLELALRKEDRYIAQMAIEVAGHWGGAAPDPSTGSRMQALFIEMSSAWYRGELPAKAAQMLFEERTQNPNWPDALPS